MKAHDATACAVHEPGVEFAHIPSAAADGPHIRRIEMPNRRDFFRTMAGAAAGTFALGHGLYAQAPARRQVSIGGRRIRVIDVHAHTDIPVLSVVKGTPFEKQGDGDPEIDERILDMDKNGVDLQALSING